MLEFPPPPTIPHERSKLSLGPDVLPAAEKENQDETINSSAAAEALLDFADPTADKKELVKDDEGSETEEEDASDGKHEEKKKGDELQLHSSDEKKKEPKAPKNKRLRKISDISLPSKSSSDKILGTRTKPERKMTLTSVDEYQNAEKVDPNLEKHSSNKLMQSGRTKKMNLPNKVKEAELP
jgi:hypothetical protein